MIMLLLVDVIITMPSASEPATISRQVDVWFKEWRVQHSKRYGCVLAEQQARRNFQANLRAIYEVNRDKSKGWWAAPNRRAGGGTNEFPYPVQIRPAAYDAKCK
jgi:hypothetical protein